MFYRLRLTLERQIAFFAGLSLAAFSLSFFVGTRISTWVNVEAVIRGFAGAFIVLFILATLCTLLILFSRRLISATIREQTSTARELSPIAIGGASICSVAEELLLRCYIFLPLAFINPILGFTVNALAVFLAYFRGRNQLAWPVIKTVEGSLYALLLLEQRSLLAVCLAHVMVEAVWFVTLRNGKLDKFV